jgi:serine/threonine protein kinase
MAWGSFMATSNQRPANVFLCSDRDRRDFVKVLDFGVAKAFALGKGDDERSDRIAVLGTPDYMAPEQALARPVDARTDVYALGCLMYKMVTGEVPFAAPDPIDLLAKQAYEPPVPPRVRRPDLDIPHAVERVILTAMEKDPAARWPTMAAMGDEIARCRFSPVPDVGPMFRLDDPAVARGRRRRRLVVASAAVAALTLGAGAAAYRTLAHPDTAVDPLNVSSR